MSDQRFKIIERLDKGGMAEVFRGVSESVRGFKKSVAIKRILPNLAKNKTFVSMFLDEARLSLFLQHANIVHVFDIGQSADTYFLVMEFVDGANLKTIIEYVQSKQGTMPIAQALYLMIEACKGLNYAHHLEHPETGEPLEIVHRDISPPNILLSKNGEVKLVDFGLAKAGSQVEETDPGVVKGKFSYLAPEAAHGQPVDSRADIFAIGIILYEMLTGRRLFFGDTDYETVQLVRDARIPSIQAQNTKVDGELESIIRKALARNPAERYQEAADLGDALSQYLFSHGLKVTARSISELVVEARESKVRKASGRHSIVDAVIQAEMNALTSLLDENGEAHVDFSQTPAEPEPAAATGELIDTSSWASDLGFDDDSTPGFTKPEPSPAPPPPPTGGARPPPIPPPRKK